MRVHWLQHVEFEGLGSIEAWLRRREAEIFCTRLFAGEILPSPPEQDLVIVMGGPMSVNDATLYPWLVEEKRFLEQVIALGRPVLGICLGAQLLASVLGARVYVNPVKEIGWFPVQGVAAGEGDGLALPDEIEVFHWHGETFDLPRGSRHLATSKACLNQAFCYGAAVVGLQFHLETTRETAVQMVGHCRDELVAGPFIQSEAEILAASDERYRVAQRAMGDILSSLLDQRDNPGRRHAVP